LYEEIGFDIPFNDATTCKLNFQLAAPPQPVASWSISGTTNMAFNVYALNGNINESADTWNNHPAQGNWLGSVTVSV